MRFLIGFLVFFAFFLGGTGYFTGYMDGRSTRKVVTNTVYEWALPARFEAQGAFTLGCALWHVPFVLPYGTVYQDGTEIKNLGIGLLEIEAGGDLLAIIDGPAGEATIDGEKCGLSVDWSAFPQQERAVPADKAQAH